MGSLTADTHKTSHKDGVPEACRCWADCECRKSSCNPRRKPPTILDVDGKEVKAGDLLERVPIGHRCDDLRCSGVKVAFEGAAAETPRASGGGFQHSERGDFYARCVDKTGAPEGRHEHVVHRREERETYYAKHEFRIVGRARNPEEERRQEIARKAEVVYLKESEAVREKYRAAAAPVEFKADGQLDGTYVFDLDAFKARLKGMRHDYYLEDLSSGEGEVMDIIGFNDEEKAVDHLLGTNSKYGKWHLWKWDPKKKAWFEAKLRRQGKSLEVVWKRGAPG